MGLAVAGVGCLLFFPAAAAAAYPLFLGALFVLASGITLLQVAANPYVTILGPARTRVEPLTLTQAFNSRARRSGPASARADPVLGHGAARRAAEAALVQIPYLGLAAVLFVIAVGVHRGSGFRSSHGARRGRADGHR